MTPPLEPRTIRSDRTTARLFFYLIFLPPTLVGVGIALFLHRIGFLMVAVFGFGLLLTGLEWLVGTSVRVGPEGFRAWSMWSGGVSARWSDVGPFVALPVQAGIGFDYLSDAVRPRWTMRLRCGYDAFIYFPMGGPDLEEVTDLLNVYRAQFGSGHDAGGRTDAGASSAVP